MHQPFLQGVAVALIALLVAPTGAAADTASFVRDVEVVPRSGPRPQTPTSNLAPTRGLYTTCPAGKSALGGGAAVRPLLSSHGLTAAGAFSTSEGRAGGTRVPPRRATSRFQPSPWLLDMQTFCAFTSAGSPPKGGGASFVKGLQVVQAASQASSSRVQEAIARCPAGKSVIGGGGGINAVTPRTPALVSLSRPDAATWRASAQLVLSGTETWAMNVRAICANVSSASGTDYAYNPRVVVNSFPTDSSPIRGGARSCGAGERVLGGGAFVEGATPGSVAPGQVVLTNSGPFDAGSVQGWSAGAMEALPTTASWRLVFRMICASS